MALTLQKMRAKKEKRRRVLEKALKKTVKQLRDMGALKIILFGSYAQGRTGSSSDLDIISVMPSIRTGKEWMKKIYEEIEREVDCDILAFTGEELEKAASVSRFIRHALETGRIVYEKGSYGRGNQMVDSG